MTLVWRVRVEPDVFYLRFYRALLENGMRSEEASLLQRAARQAEESVYTLFSGQHMIRCADF
ncbi:MAG: hypothetical protein HQL75_10390 [Magnetococcales bacterium]|nr:hypothetical protein [Magnetococcales bacterium]